LLTDKSAIKNLKFSPVFEGRGDGIHTCPVTGERVTGKTVFFAEYFGRTPYFCCAGCLKSAQRYPDKYVKPTELEQVDAVKVYLARVPEAPSGEEYCNE
jgi:YHS domain-containing protein